MKILSRFKQLKKDIKLVIITVLIMSCIGVYATGTCIVAATADDVTYNNTTVSAALNDLYELTQNYCPPGYECRQLKYVTDCDNNIILPTIPNNLSGLAKIMAENAYLDNGKSEYMTSCNGVDFSDISSDTNGKGIYEIASTKNDTYPIYYYRGAVDNNNVKFAGFCWKAVRTTDTGGVKLIYNGEPDQDGYCSNTTGTSTRIGYSQFNIDTSPSYIGYMYGTVYQASKKNYSDLSTSFVYGNNVTYSNGMYTLQDTMTSTGIWKTDYNKLSNNHYTCFSTENTCNEVFYIYYLNQSFAWCIHLVNGKTIEDVLEEDFNGNNINMNNSDPKTMIDDWYSNNLVSYTPYIEDTVYCNDRSPRDLENTGWNPNGGNPIRMIVFNTADRTFSTFSPTLTCTRNVDRFTVSSSNGNGALTYPAGLISSDEVMYAGANEIVDNNTYYLYSNRNYWTSSLRFQTELTSIAINVDSDGSFSSIGVHSEYDIRPVVSLKSTDVVESGDGTQTNPYVIKTS